jgi:hypothetical protein
VSRVGPPLVLLGTGLGQASAVEPNAARGYPNGAKRARRDEAKDAVFVSCCVAKAVGFSPASLGNVRHTGNARSPVPLIGSLARIMQCFYLCHAEGCAKRSTMTLFQILHGYSPTIASL